MKMKIALLQFDVIPGNIKFNEATVSKLLEECSLIGVDAVVMPELWNCGYDLEHLPELAQNMSGSSIKLLTGLAAKYKLFIFGGSIGERKGEHFYNTMVVINQAGEIVEKYRKIHLFPLGLREEEFFATGDEWGLVETPWGKVGLMICYDLRFPELARNLALRGAKAIVIPAQWPGIRTDHWYTLNMARAIENQIFVFACNRIGKDASGRYQGCSMIVDSWGKVLAGGLEATEPGIIVSEVDFDLNQEVLSKIPVYSDRKNILDEIDNSQI